MALRTYFDWCVIDERRLSFSVLHDHLRSRYCTLKEIWNVLTVELRTISARQDTRGGWRSILTNHHRLRSIDDYLSNVPRQSLTRHDISHTHRSPIYIQIIRNSDGRLTLRADGRLSCVVNFHEKRANGRWLWRHAWRIRCFSAREKVDTHRALFEGAFSRWRNSKLIFNVKIGHEIKNWCYHLIFVDFYHMICFNATNERRESAWKSTHTILTEFRRITLSLRRISI